MSDVLNVYMGNDVQIGSLPIEDHNKILAKAKRNFRLYIMQAANFVSVFINCYAYTLKLFVFGALLLNAIYYFNGDPFIPYVVESAEKILTGRTDKASEFIIRLFLYNTIKMFANAIVSGAVVALFISAMSTLSAILDLRYSQRSGRQREGAIFGSKNYFMDFVDSEIKKLLQEQSEGSVWVVVKKMGNNDVHVNLNAQP